MKLSLFEIFQNPHYLFLISILNLLKLENILSLNLKKFFPDFLNYFVLNLLLLNNYFHFNNHLILIIYLLKKYLKL